MPVATPLEKSAPSRGLFGWFKPAPPKPAITDLEQVNAGYRHWQPRILVAATIGYAVFYFVRVNISIAMPGLEKSLHITKTDIGLFLTLHGIVYGLSKFFNGFLGDRSNARTFMFTGLILSALANFAFGCSSWAWMMGSFWVLNGYFQGMGFPPCARLLTHWFPPKKLATKMSVWNISHSVGAGLILVICGYLVTYSWRLCFFVPAGIAVITAVYLLIFLRDTPESLGLPGVEHLEDLNSTDATPPAAACADAEPQTPSEEFSYSKLLRSHVFTNPYIWLISMANFFVYTIRYAILLWAPTFLSQAKGIQITHAGWMDAGFEVAGVCGMLTGGWITDNIFGGRGIRSCFFYMLGCCVALYLFWRLPHQSQAVSTLLLCATGFCIYGPQCLVGICAANLATKRAAAAAVGLTGLFGYASTTLSGVGLGYLVQHYGWSAGFRLLILVSAVGALLFLLGWNAKAHGYES